MGVARATTPTFLLQFSQQGLDLTAANNVYVTFQSGSKIMTKTGDDLSVNEQSIGVYLTQKETIVWGVGKVKIQANWTTGNGGRAASEIVEYDISAQLLDEVVT